MKKDFPKMVGWYSPRLLLKAAVEVIVSSLFGQHADQRTVQALTGKACLIDYSSGTRKDIPVDAEPVSAAAPEGMPEVEEPVGEFWFDYVADVADGWDSTYSVAWLLSREELDLQVYQAPDSASHNVQRGKLLFFGGDLVYPTASREEYARRLTAPYTTAFNDGVAREETGVFAIPGNHDWYDSLRSFSRLFFTEGSFVDAPQSPSVTPQKRSYFAVKLPHQWWVLATDVQLGSDIDANQLEYFRAVARQFQEGDKVVLCTAEPHWYPAKRAKKHESKTAATVLDRLEQILLGERVRVFIAGDVHHYLRYQSADPGAPSVHKVTAGGGGAFLHPTHRTWPQEINEPQVDQQQPPRKYQLQPEAAFPRPTRSFGLSLRNFLFPFINPRFGVLTAILYIVFALMMMPAVKRHEEAKADIANEQLARKEARFDDMLRDVVKETTGELNVPVNLLPEIDFDNVIRQRPARKRGDATDRSHKEVIDNFAEQVRIVPGTGDAMDPNVPTISTATRDKYLQLDELAKQIDLDQEALQQSQQGFVKAVGKSFRESAVNRIDHEQPTRDKRPDRQHTKAAPERASEDAEPDTDNSFLGWAMALFVELTVQESRIPDPFQSMFAILFFVAVVSGFVAFTGIPNMAGRLVLGTLHGCLHWAAAFLIMLIAGLALDTSPLWTVMVIGASCLVIVIAYVQTADSPGASWLAKSIPVAPVFAILVLVLAVLALNEGSVNSAVAIVVFVAGWIAGSFIMGAYLWFVHTLFGQHWNEAFSSIRCQDWKCFVRFRVSPNGTLTIYPIGIPRVTRKWEKQGSHFRPRSANDLQPILIEPPIVVSPPENAGDIS